MVQKVPPCITIFALASRAIYCFLHISNEQKFSSSLSIKARAFDVVLAQYEYQEIHETELVSSSVPSHRTNYSQYVSAESNDKCGKETGSVGIYCHYFCRVIYFESLLACENVFLNDLLVFWDFSGILSFLTTEVCRVFSRLLWKLESVFYLRCGKIKEHRVFGFDLGYVRCLGNIRYDFCLHIFPFHDCFGVPDLEAPNGHEINGSQNLHVTM